MSKADFNSYGSRRGNHEVMMRGTFANVRIKNLMLPLRPTARARKAASRCSSRPARRCSIYDAAMHYIAQGTPTVVFAGEEYGTGSSRDWAAKGTQLLGVKAVVAQSFERIHRSNLVGMGVLPLQFKGTRHRAHRSGINGDETFDIVGLEASIRPQQDLTLVIHRKDGTTQDVPVLLPHRHADRGRLLPARRHPAVRAAGADGDGGVALLTSCTRRAAHPAFVRQGQALPGFIPQAPGDAPSAACTHESRCGGCSVPAPADADMGHSEGLPGAWVMKPGDRLGVAPCRRAVT